jgi:hypothetical protein
MKVPVEKYVNRPVWGEHPFNHESLLKSVISSLQKRFELVEKFPPGNFLDNIIGCGEGYYVEAAKLLGWRAFGTEIDPVKID